MRWIEGFNEAMLARGRTCLSIREGRFPLRNILLHTEKPSYVGVER
jgi:hypothetical protein